MFYLGIEIILFEILLPKDQFTQKRTSVDLGKTRVETPSIDDFSSCELNRDAFVNLIQCPKLTSSLNANERF